MKTIIKKVLNKDDSLLKAGFIFMLGSGFASGLNYLYHLLIGRMLGPEQYGVLGSLFAIIYFVTFASATFNKVLSKFSAEFQGRNQINLLTRLIQQAFYKIIYYGFILFLIYIMISKYIANFMHLKSISGVIIVGAIGYFSLIQSILNGALNGLQKFVWQNLSGVTSILIKLVLGVLFVYLGFGVNGALAGILIGALFSIGLSYYVLRKIFRKKERIKLYKKRIYRFAIPVILSAIFPTLLITVDQVLVKHFFTSIQAGYYAAAGMIAKIIWFGSGFLLGALFPKIVKLNTEKKDISKLLLKTIIYTLILVLLGCSVYFVMPNFIVNVLYGKAFLEISPMIGVFGLAMGMFSIIQVFITYNLAAEKYGFIWILFFGVMLEILAIFYIHNSIFEIIQIFFGTNVFMLFLFLFYNRNEFTNNLFKIR